MSRDWWMFKSSNSWTYTNMILKSWENIQIFQMLSRTMKCFQQKLIHFELLHWYLCSTWNFEADQQVAQVRDTFDQITGLGFFRGTANNEVQWDKHKWSEIYFSSYILWPPRFPSESLQSVTRDCQDWVGTPVSCPLWAVAWDLHGSPP